MLNRFYRIGDLISQQANEQKLLHHPLKYPHVIILIRKTSTGDNASKNRNSASQFKRRPAALQGRPVMLPVHEAVFGISSSIAWGDDSSTGSLTAL
jgi:hypothetical protein